MKSKYRFKKLIVNRKKYFGYHLFSIEIENLWDLFINDHLEKEQTHVDSIEIKWKIWLFWSFLAYHSIFAFSVACCHHFLFKTLFSLESRSLFLLYSSLFPCFPASLSFTELQNQSEQKELPCSVSAGTVSAAGFINMRAKLIKRNCFCFLFK